MNNKIAILLATCNGVEHIKEQLNSLCSQTYSSYEIIVRDDKSSDETVRILKSYNVNILASKENFGVKGNFSFLLNYALQNTHSEYFMFCDQDDVWENDKIEKTLNKMKNLENKYIDTPLLVHTDLTVADNKLNSLNSSFWNYEDIDPKINSFNRLLTQNTITGCTVMINRRLAKLAVPIPSESVMHDSWLGLIASRFGKIGIVNESTVLYRQHSLNSVGTKGFGIRYILNKLSEENILSQNTAQAQVFLNIYRNKLDKETIEMLEDFSTIESKSFWKRRKILLRHKLLKQGLIRNIGLLAKI